MRVYLDYNVYDCIRRGIIQDFISKTSDTYYISVAHVEEFYNECMNDSKNEYIEKHDQIKKLFLESNSKGILNPTIKSSIRNIPEKFDDVLDRINADDTRDFVKNQGKVLSEDNTSQKNLCREKNPLAINYSNLSSSEIWDVSEIKGKIETFSEFCKDYGKLTYEQLKTQYGPLRARIISKRTEDDYDFELKHGIGKELCNNFQRLEMVIEYLHKILSEVGYNDDKNIPKSISGIHDTSHTIYATYCEIFVTNDMRFAKRIKAVYEYLGIHTKVLSLDEYLSNLITNTDSFSQEL